MTNVKIRKGLFETNSSSTHTIVIANNNRNDFKKSLPEKLYFNAGCFGWEFDKYTDVHDRASYLFTGLLSYSVCEKYIPIIKKTLKKYDVEAVFPEIAIKNKYEQLKNDNTYYYVDHSEELEDFFELVCNDEVLLMNFLFSPESFIATGNDNDDEELDDSTNAKNA